MFVRRNLQPRQSRFPGRSCIARMNGTCEPSELLVEASSGPALWLCKTTRFRECGRLGSRPSWTRNRLCLHRLCRFSHRQSQSRDGSDREDRHGCPVGTHTHIPTFCSKCLTWNGIKVNDVLMLMMYLSWVQFTYRYHRYNRNPRSLQSCTNVRRGTR